MTTPLSEVFSTEADARITEPEIQATEEVTGDTEVLAESTDEVKAEEAAPPAAKPDDSADIMGQLEAFKAKALDETRKRQELESRLKQQEIERPDAYAEPEKAIEHAVNQVRAEMQSQYLNLSEANARARHSDDFEQMKGIFFDEMLVDNPMLQQQALMQPDPYGWIYNQAKNHSELKNIGNVGDWQKQKEAEIEARLRAEYDSKLKSKTEQLITDSIPNTLGKATAVGGHKSSQWAGPTPLNKVFSK